VPKPHVRALEGIAWVGRKQQPGYELLTALGMHPGGRLALGYATRWRTGRKGLPACLRKAEEVVGKILMMALTSSPA
jgi:hypothetical protein